MLPLLRKIQRNVEDYGFLNTVKKGMLYLLTPIYEDKVYTIYGIDLENLQPKRFDNNRFTFKKLEKDNIEIIKQIEKMEEWLRGKLEFKLKKGALCLVALQKEKVAAFNLISFSEVLIPLIRLKKSFAEDEAWSEQITVHKDYRQKGLGTELRYRVFSELKTRGIKRLYGGSLKNNQANLKLTRKVGFQELVDINYKREKISFIRTLKWKKCSSQKLGNQRAEPVFDS